MLSCFANALLLGDTISPILVDRDELKEEMGCNSGVAKVRGILDIICCPVEVSVEGEGEFEGVASAEEAAFEMRCESAEHESRGDFQD